MPRILGPYAASRPASYPASHAATGRALIDADAKAFAESVGATDTARLSRLFSTLKGAGVYDSLLAAWPMRSGSNAGSGTTVHDITGSHDLTIGGAMPWAADGFSFDGDNDHLLSSGAVLPTTAAQAAVMFIWKKDTTTAATTEYIAGQYTLTGVGRVTFQHSTVDAVRSFRNAGGSGYSLDSGTSEISSLTRSSLFAQDATDWRLHLDGNSTAVDSNTLSPTAFLNTNFNIGRHYSVATTSDTGEHWKGKISLALVFGSGISGATFATLHAALINDWQL